MKILRKELERRMRDAYEVLKRARPGGAITAEGTGPVDPHVAIGYARACLRIGLGLPKEDDKV